MLYVTTRNNRDAFTANRAMREERCPDGGFYVPFRKPRLTQEDVEALAGRTFNQNVADALNLMFNTKLTCDEIDFCIGKNPVRIEVLRQRIILAEAWHNTGWSLNRMVGALSNLVCGQAVIPTDWMRIAVRVAVLFGVFGELQRQGIACADISVVAGDFCGPISAWYARQWGLPVGNIVCCCNENNNLWDLLCHGQLRTDTVSMPTLVPEADVTLPTDLERLIYECGGIPEAARYLEACRTGKAYFPNDAVLSRLRSGLYVSVVSSQRIEATIPSAYRTHGYVMSPHSALAYAGLLDYRAKTGETGYAVVFSEKSPASDAQTTAEALGIPAEKLKELL